jgi:hypothetical protein
MMKNRRHSREGGNPVVVGLGHCLHIFWIPAFAGMTRCLFGLFFHANPTYEAGQ